MREHLCFLQRFIGDPKGIGAVAPSGSALAAAMAACTDPTRAGPLLELGPGTGVVTRALIARGFQPERITAVEADSHFAAALRRGFPRVNVVEGDAFRLAEIAGSARFAAIVSSLPLLNFPPAARRAFIADALSRLLPGAPLVQFSYGFRTPATAPEGACAELAARVWRNLPPARVWVYWR